MPNQPADKETINSLEAPPKSSPKSKARMSKNDFVLDTFENLTLELSTSCTKEDAVAKMLGWLRGPLRIDPDSLNIHNISLKMMPFLPKLYYSLEDHLMMLREDAVELLAEANESNITEAVDELNKCEELIMDANVYMCSIDDELLKGGSSSLRIDETRSKKEGELYITIRSLDLWAKENYDVSIIDDITPFHWDISSLPQKAKTETKLEELTTQNGLSKTKSEHLYTTFALLVEALSDVPKSGYKQSDKPNIDAIAKHLNYLAGKCSDKESPSGQSIEAIKDRIEEAIKIKTKKLKFE